MNQDNTQPDFNFIMSQPGPEPEKPRRSNKPFVFFGIATAVFITLLAGALIIPRVLPSKSVDYSGTAQRHLELINSGKYDESHAMFANKDAVSRQNYLLVWQDFLPKNYDLKKCKLDSMNTRADTVDVFVVCPRLESTSSSKFRYEFTKGSTAINKIESNNASS